VIAAFVAFAWLLGIATAAYTGSDIAATIAAASLLGAVTFAYRPRLTTLCAVAAAAALVLLGTWRYESTTPTIPPNAIQAFNDGDEVRFRAVIGDEPQERSTSTIYRLEVHEVWGNGRWHDASGAILMTAQPYPAFEYGDLVDVRGELATPPVLEDFDYREYLMRQGIASLIQYPEVRVIAVGQGNPILASLIDIRADLASSLQAALPEPEASLSTGILLGARQSLPPDLRNDMDATGTSHLVAVSGQNITILAAAVLATLAWLIGRRTACWAALAAIIAYAAFVGAEPSVVRATIMGAVFILSIAFGRQNSGWVALLLAAALMTAQSPQVVHEVSFQLSFAAVLGLVVLASPLHVRLESALERSSSLKDFPLTRPATDVVVLSLASIAFTLPITAVNFHQVSVVAPVANLFVVPAFVAVAGTSATVALAGLISPEAADVLAWIAWLPAAYMTSTIGWFADIPLASVRLEGVAVAHAVAYYAMLGALVAWLRRPPIRMPEPPKAPAPSRRGLSVAALALVLGLSSALVWLALTGSDPGRLSVIVLDVGQGDAILIETPSGNRVLIDGGPSESVLAAALGRHLPFYDRRIDLVAATHPQSDHIGGLPVALDRYDVGAVIDTGVEPESAVGEHWRGALDASGVMTFTPTRGQKFDLGDGAALTVVSPRVDPPLPPANLNDTSLVLRLTYGQFSMLFTGDLGPAGEIAIGEMGTSLRSTVLKVSHHGSRTSTSADFLDLVHSSVAVISVGNDNRFGHPAPDVLDRLVGQSILRTDESGDITLETNGQAVWVFTQK
jgi:competence protein ComEC